MPFLFPADLPAREWVTFPAAGYRDAACGVIYRNGEVMPGLPLGGLGTGFIPFGTDGTLDYCSTIFNHHLERRYHAAVMASVPGENPDHWIRRPHLPTQRQPFLALQVGDRAIPLTSRWVTGGQNLPAVADLRYWGHYPIADVQFGIADCPVTVALRAWTPFLPGCAEESNTPGAVFEVRLRNDSATAQPVTLAFGFHGPRPNEVGPDAVFARHELTGQLVGVQVITQTTGPRSTPATGAAKVYAGMEYGADAAAPGPSDPAPFTYAYALGVLDASPGSVRTGAEVTFATPTNFRSLPAPAASHAGATVAVDATLPAGEERVVRFVLAWHAPRWRTQVRPPFPEGGSAYAGQVFHGKSTLIHRYADRFADAAAVARYLAANHESLLRRIIAWQETIYREERLPVWLRDSLVNVFAILAHVSTWTRNADPAHWWGNDGLFSCLENLTACPQQACIANDEFGEWPVDLFFPALARNKLRVFQHHQRADGKPPSTLGMGTEPDQHWYDQQPPVDGQVYIHLIDRIWQVTGDDTILDQFYPSVTACLDYLKTIDADGDGVLDVNGSNQYYDTWPTMAGAAIHISTYWVATLRIVARMAEHRGDTARVADCRQWEQRAAATIERTLWNEATGSYRVFHQPATGVKSDSILSDQLIGQFFIETHALGAFLPDDRVRRVLETILAKNAKAARFGLRTAVRADGQPDGQTFQSGLQTPSYSTLVPACLMIRHGKPEQGLELVRSTWEQMVLKKSMAWDQPCMLTPDGDVGFGIEYYHNTMLWVLPLAVLGEDLKSTAGAGGFVHRILNSAKGR